MIPEPVNPTTDVNALGFGVRLMRGGRDVPARSGPECPSRKADAGESSAKQHLWGIVRRSCFRTNFSARNSAAVDAVV